MCFQQALKNNNRLGSDTCLSSSLSWSDEGAPFPSQTKSSSIVKTFFWFLILGMITYTSIKGLVENSITVSTVWIIYESYIIFDHIPFLFTNTVYKSPRFNFTYLSTIFFWGLEAVACIVAAQSPVCAPKVLLYNVFPHLFFIAANNFNGAAASKSFIAEQKKTWWVYLQVMVDNMIHATCLFYHVKYVSMRFGTSSFSHVSWWTGMMLCLSINNFGTTGATVTVGSANAGTFEGFDGPWVAKYTGGSYCSSAQYGYDRTTTVKVVFTSDISQHGTTEALSDGCHFIVRYKCYCAAGDAACNVSNFLGQDFYVAGILNEESPTGAVNTDHPVDINNLGASGTAVMIGSANGGGFTAVDGGTDVVYNLNGDVCANSWGARTTRFRVIYTEDRTEDGTLTSSQWRCRYHVDYKCFVPPTEWDGSWYIVYDTVDLADDVLTSSYLTKPGVDVSTDVSVAHTEGTCAEGGAPHDGSVITATTSTATVVDDTVDDTLDVAKTLDTAVIASDYSGSFVFCETVTLKNGDVNVAATQTEYTITADFLATIGAYTSTLEDVSSVTTVDEQTLSIDGTVVAARCDGATDNVRPGDYLCLEISESDSANIGVQSIHNLDLTQGAITFAAINDGEIGYADLVEVECAVETCKVNVVVPSTLFVDDSGSGATTFTLNISGDVYLYNMSGKDSESEPKGFDMKVQLEKTCQGGFLRGITSMLPN